MLLDTPWRNRRTKTPTVIQMEALECGAAALGIVLGHFGRFVALEVLRVQCGVSRDGSNALGLLKAARSYGLEAGGFRLEPEKLGALPLPAILFWEFNHFVVLEGIKGDTVYLNDPATGPRQVSRQELDWGFTGVALAFQPGPGFQPGGKRSSPFSYLLGQALQAGSGLWLLMLVGLTMVVPGLLIPLFGQVFVDEILIQGNSDWFKPLLFGMAITAALRGMLSWLEGGLLVRLRLKMATAMSARFMEHLLRLPYLFFTQRFGGEIGDRMRLNDAVARILTGDLAFAGVNLVSVVFFAALMLSYDLLLTAIGVSFALLNLLLLLWVNRRRVDLNRRMLQESGKLIGTTMNGLQMIETIKATASETDLFLRLAGRLTKLKRSQQHLATWSLVTGTGPKLIQAVSTALVLGIGAQRVMDDGPMTMGMLVAFQSLMSSFLEPFSRLVALSTSLQAIQADVERVRDVLSYEPDTLFGQPPAVLTEAKPISGELTFRAVTFGYSPTNPPWIEGLNLHLAPGVRVALVGGSGSGKSTVARLACGLILPWEGAVLCDGAPLTDLKGRSLAGAMTLVDQDIFLFEGSVRDNISMWRKDMDSARLVAAAKDAMIHEHIMSLPGGYEAQVLEGGANLSGGQRQRLEIARALAMEPAILILDEATSALDVNTEKQVMENIRRRGITCLIVAHRLSTIRDCDEIIVLENGKVAQRGAHAQLMRSAGAYSRLIET